jgi:hypothetical protein
MTRAEERKARELRAWRRSFGMDGEGPTEAKPPLRDLAGAVAFNSKDGGRKPKALKVLAGGKKGANPR